MVGSPIIIIHYQISIGEWQTQISPADNSHIEQLIKWPCPVQCPMHAATQLNKSKFSGRQRARNGSAISSGIALELKWHMRAIDSNNDTHRTCTQIDCLVQNCMAALHSANGFQLPKNHMHSLRLVVDVAIRLAHCLLTPRTQMQQIGTIVERFVIGTKGHTTTKQHK